MSTVIGIYQVALGAARLVGTASLDRHGEVVLESDEPHLDRFLRPFLCLPPAGSRRPLSIADGEEWLEALPYALAGTYCWASPLPTS